MKLKVLSFSGENFSHENVTSVTLMTKSCEVTILNNHSPMIASIEPCVLYIRFMDENNIEQREDFAVGS
jgi:F0F1-type ATP synthase epsilon subunit